MISRTALHAVKALVTLAGLPARACLGAGAIAKSTGAPPNYLGKLLQGLVRHGLVESQKGLRGGFRLARDPAAISLLDVVEPIDQVSRWSGCILGGTKCDDRQPCAIHDRWKVVRKGYLDLLGRTTLAELARRSPRGMAWPQLAPSTAPQAKFSPSRSATAKSKPTKPFRRGKARGASRRA